jgi:catechol 2,3-dioxygenase-like lactoylglutathione lyase family enzyme
MSDPFVNERSVFQVCFVTGDIEKSKSWLAGVLGVEPPTTIVSGAREEAETKYRGAASDARCKMAFFPLDNTTIELIEPDEHPSCWRDFLDRNGPGCHHIAFRVGGMKRTIAAFEAGGHPLLQKGEFAGGRYAYVDTEPQLGILVELLEFDRAAGSGGGEAAAAAD